MPPTRIRLTRKLAEAIDGVDLRGWTVGEVREIPEHDARYLIAEGWAQPDGAASRDADVMGASSSGDGDESY